MDKSKKFLELIPTKHSHIFDVKLNLEFQSRYIGKLDTSGQGKFLANRKAKHLHRITNSLGLNAELINSSEFNFRTIVINYEGKKLITTRLYFLTHSKIFSFKGFEKQYFLPLDEFGIQKAEEYERLINNQLGLFGEVA
jgi:hypothetical protein